MYSYFELTSDCLRSQKLKHRTMSLAFVVRYHFEKHAHLRHVDGENTPKILYSATVLVVFDPTQKYHGATITQAAYRAAIIEGRTAVGSRPDSTAAHVVNSVKILPDSILFVNFHHIVFVYNDYSVFSITVAW